MMRLTTIAFVLICVGCVPGKITRDKDSYMVETFATLARQNEAARALFKAADAAKAAGDSTACAEYAAPALLIEAKAQAQAYRSLFLAGLPYPKPDGSMPDDFEDQDDPGIGERRRGISDICD